MRKTYYYCDRCGREIKTGSEEEFNERMLNADIETKYGVRYVLSICEDGVKPRNVELCPKCERKLFTTVHNYLVGGK